MIQFPEKGKTGDEFLKAMIFPFCGSERSEIKTAPQYGVDVSIISLPNGFEMALTSDPLTLIPTLGLQESAWLSVCLMANDMSTTGKAPMYAQFVLNLPQHFPATDFEIYWQHIDRYCKAMGTAITGGHTGRAVGINSTIAGGGTMITIAPEGEMLVSKGANEGDIIVVTRSSALIASSVLALSFPETVSTLCGREVQQKAGELFYETSVLPTALIAASLDKSEGRIITAMHDVTEGGILGAIYEMALASGCGALVEKPLLPTGFVQEQVCQAFDIDPLFSLGAGSMIIAVKKEHSSILIDRLEAEGINATAVGIFTPTKSGINIRENETKALEHPGTDPYWNAFYTAAAKGLK
jgi:hydrogenase expression/formation protein HypE